MDGEGNSTLGHERGHETSRAGSREPLALVGIGCRFPGGADGPDLFWKLLLDGVDAVIPVPSERWTARHDHLVGMGQGGFLAGVDRFDPLFFGISPREAARMDPQQRLLLEVAWEALEDAGLPLERLWGSPTGVFVGISNRDYADLQSFRTVGTHTSTGEAVSIAANRLSWCFHLTGPSMAVDTACSSGLTAVHLACRSLWSGECTLALAGAVNLVLTPRVGASFSALGMLSPEGRCRAFDARGGGFVRGEGAAVVALKPLSAALRDGDPVYAVVRATAVNQDGHSPGMTVPSQPAQEDLIRGALAQAGLQPAEVGYVEAHGTGTPVGDPIEARALAAVLGPTVVGSVKTNLGHLEPASGLAGLVKAALVLRHRTVPANLHFDEPHPELPRELHVPTAAEPLRGETALVNSFGFGGANAHAVLARPPEVAPPPSPGRPPYVLLLSGHTREALEESARAMERHLRQEVPPLPDLAYTAAVRRTHQTHRLAVVGETLEDLLEGLRSGREAHEGRAPGREPVPVAFLFTGQGSQWAGMGLRLLEEPVFRSTFERVDGLLRDLGGWSLVEALQDPERLRDTAVAQPAIFALQVGLVDLLESWGVRPAAVLGHSVGEVAAACAAGVYTLEEGARLVFQRGRLMSTAAPGAMLAVGLPEEQARRWLRDGVEFGAVTGPDLVTLSGDERVLAEVQEGLEAEAVFCRSLGSGYAFHHASMEPLREDLLRHMAGLRPQPARVRLASSVTGTWAEGPEWDEHYQWRNVRQTVQFARGLETLIEGGLRTFLELGPHPALCRSVTDLLDHRGERGTALPTLLRQQDDRLAARRALARLHVNGVGVRWEALFPPGRPVRLPRYPWQRERCWVDDPRRRRELLEPADHPLLGRRQEGPRPEWEAEISLRSHAWLADHRLGEHPLLPATAFLEMGLAAARAESSGTLLEAEDVALERALFLQDEPAEVRVGLEGDRFTVWSRAAEGWTRHATGRVRARDSAHRPALLPLAALKRHPRRDQAELLEEFARRGLGYGPAFQGLQEAWVGEGEVLGRVEFPEAEGWLLHPAALDACLQATLLLLPRDGRVRLPVSIRSYRLLRSPGSTLYVHARGDSATVADEAGQPVAVLEGLEFQVLEEEGHLLYRFRWEEAPLAAPVAGTWRVLGSPELERRLQALGQRIGEGGGVVDLRPPSGDLAADLLRTADLARSLREGPLVVVTRHAHGERPDPRATAVWGLVRTVASERPELRVRLLDAGEGETEALAREIASGADETEVMLRGERRLVRRLRRVTAEDLAREAVRLRPGGARLAAPRSGVLEDLLPVACRVPEPGPGEVVVEVRAAGVNFSDVLKAMGLYPGTPGGALEMGLEMAGMVAAAGPGVDLAPGDRVMGLARGGGALGSLVLTSAAMLAPIPDGVSFEEAGGVPVAFLTAWYALWRQGHLRPGETVLVHSASGGVGLAALQMCAWTGATALATAGTAEKRELLRALGVEHVFDSRSLDFARQAREATGGRGVDLVLNSLAGEALAAGLEALAPGGRFVELGKRDIYSDARLGLRPLRNNLSVFGVDLEQIIKLRPDVIEDGLKVVGRGFQQGRLRPLPTTVVPLGRASEAFRTLAAARHVGKVVLTSEPVPSAPEDFATGGTWLVVGGLGGFGREAARWLAARGAERLVLVGRRGRGTPGAGDLEAELGQRVEIVGADMADGQQARAVVERFRPLRGVVHAAMVLDDAFLEDLDSERLSRVLRPKAEGAWHLHEATRDEPLEAFVTFSSAASVFGNPGQAAYCAANDFLDGLAARRRAEGLPALSVQWGAVADAGWLAGRPDVRRHLERMGVLPVPAAEALRALGTLLAAETPAAVVARVDWSRLARSLGGSRPVFEDLAGPGGRTAPEAGSVMQRLRERLGGVVGLPPERLDPSRPLTDLGLDSLMVFEVRNWLSDTFGVAVAAADLLKGPTLEELAATLSRRTNGTAGHAAPAEAPPPPPPPAAPEVKVNGRSHGLEDLPDFQEYRERRRAMAERGLDNPYFRVLDGVAGPEPLIDGRRVVNFCSYNYLGLCGHPEVDGAALEAIHRYGTSASASRLAAGERPLHRDLETALAAFLGTEDALALVSGHATNTALIPHLVGPGDLVVHDSLIHNSALQGALASRATRRAFPHADLDALDRLLREQRGRYRRALVLVEGLYSMDGDFPDLARLLDLKDRHGFLLLVDEAHSLGVLGATGRGLCEEAGLSRDRDVIWMGTLSKTLASCGGYLAGSGALIDYLKHTLGGFVFSVGMPPASAAAARAALRVLEREPERVQRLRRNSQDLLALLRGAGFDVGLSAGAAVVPVLVGDSERCMALSHRLWEDGVNVSPAVYPAVAPDQSRLRFFVTSEHTPEHLARAVEVLGAHLPAAR